MSGGAKKLLHAAAGTSAAGGSGLFVEDVFSTFLYTGNGATGQSIVNGIDLSGEGGLVWGKSTDNNAGNSLYDTARGIGKSLSSNGSGPQGTDQAGKGLTAFNNNGFSVGDDWSAAINLNNSDMCSWSFRKAAGFFDIVTYSGDSSASKQISHNLGSAPAMMLIKRTDDSVSWAVFHKNLPGNSGTGKGFLSLNTTDNNSVNANCFSTLPTSTEFTVNANYGGTNGNGASYVAYLFGDDAIFGEDGDEQICKMGTFTTDGDATPQDIDLGFEPQWFIYKRTDSSSNWFMADIIRGWTAQDSGVAGEMYLYANLGAAEASSANPWGSSPTSSGITWRAEGLTSNSTYIYMAIRRPMKEPSAGTEVYFQTTANSGTTLNTGFVPDFWIGGATAGNGGTNSQIVMDRLRGAEYLATTTTAAEIGTNDPFNGFPTNTFTNNSQGGNRVEWLFRRAPKFMDVVAYTGTGSSHAVTHNLNTTPELIIIKKRSEASYGGWAVYYGTGSNLILNRNHATGYWYSNAVTAASSTTFTVVDNIDVNDSGEDHIAFLFATLDGISKVGSVSHSGTTNVDCGFSNGARFVLAKRTDAAGDWYVWDTARGIVSGNDSYLLLNSSSAQVTNTDLIDPLSSGFTLSDDFTDGTYIFLAIA